MASITEIIEYCDAELRSREFKDYCPNGLQVAGCEEVNYLVSGVTASQALIDRAIEASADAILVHHGYFWRGEDPCIRGMKRRRLKALLANDLNLIAYHLPLDAHPTLGNNAGLAELLGFKADGSLRDDGVGSYGHLTNPMDINQLQRHVAERLARDPMVVAAGPKTIRRVAWCTGGAQELVEQAAARGVDAYLSGEISEQTTHVARECGIHYIAAGHHASERYGAQRLGEELARRFGLRHEFIDIDNPA